MSTAQTTMSPQADHLAFMRVAAVSAPVQRYRAIYARQARELASLIIQAGCHPVSGARAPLRGVA